MIKILSSGGIRLGVVKNAITATRLEEINGENTLDFEAVFDSQIASLIDENSMFELGDDYFDTALFSKTANEDGTYTVAAEAEHVSYRLNAAEFNKEYFTELGTPTYILGKILEGTGFTVGTVEFTAQTTYSAQEAKSRRQLLMEFVAYLGGEVKCDKYVISILTRRGSASVVPVIRGRDVKVLSKEVNKRVLDESNNPTVSYKCTPIYLPGSTYALGDDIRLINQEVGINELLRVVRITYNPYDTMEAVFEFANYTNDLASSLYRIMTQGVVKDALYNGARIGPEFGFESVRNDKKARSYFRSDGMKFQTGDGTGENWVDRLYYEYDAETGQTVLVLDGKLSAGMIEALEAQFDVTISNTMVTNVLSAGSANIAELTVDRLETSDKVQKYKDSSSEDVRYIKAEDQVLKWVSGEKSSGTIQVEDRDGNPLYWKDDTFEVPTIDETDYPIMVYNYEEWDKLVIEFYLDNGAYIPRMVWGAGSGQGGNAKGYIYKFDGSFQFTYLKYNGDDVSITLGENGAVVKNGGGAANAIRNCSFGTAIPTAETLAPGDIYFKYT